MAEKDLHIQGKEGAGRWDNEADRVTASRVKPVYESKEFNIGAQTDYSVKVNESAFVKFARAHTVIIRTDQDITLKLNLDTNEAISLSRTERTVTLDIVELTDIFFTTTVATNIKIILV